MSFNYNKTFWEEFIAIYKTYSCLWKIKSKEFRNTELRNDAYKKLIEKCKEINKEADKEFVKNKINSLRTTFRRELLKARELQEMSPSTDYVPKLWYFNLLKFLSDEEEERVGVSPAASPGSFTDESLASIF